MTDWYDHAACRGVDIAIFYPGRGDEGRPSRQPNAHNIYDAARTICGRCPVTEQCLKQTMIEEGGSRRWGFRGGLTWRERGKLNRRTCKWCREWFPVDPMPGRGGKHPSYCGDQCREAAADEIRRLANERQAIARWEDRPTECDLCGFESRTTSGLAAHRRQLHGVAA